MRPCIGIYYSNVSYCSTCFERHIAHHQELNNCICSLWFYIRLWLPAAVSGQQPQTYIKPEAVNTVVELLMMSDVSLETYWAIRNVGLINSNTWSHVVGYFYMIYTMMQGSRNIKLINRTMPAVKFNKFNLL
jgi:hypothetical protein